MKGIFLAVNGWVMRKKNGKILKYFSHVVYFFVLLWDIIGVRDTFILKGTRRKCFKCSAGGCFSSSLLFIRCLLCNFPNIKWSKFCIHNLISAVHSKDMTERGEVILITRWKIDFTYWLPPFISHRFSRAAASPWTHK